MNARDFNFIVQQQKSTAAETKRKLTANGCSKLGALLPPPGASKLLVNDGDRFLRIVERTSKIASHRELFELLQSEAIQRFLPHQILISAWGGFDVAKLQYDVISGIPGMRTGLVASCAIDSLLTDLRQRWLVHQQQPLLLDSSMDIRLPCSNCAHDCALQKFLQGIWSVLVHGVANVRDDNLSLYLAFNANSIVNGHSIERFRLLVDQLITQIDVACRRITALKPPGLPADQESPTSFVKLTPREAEILQLVSEGNSNPEISKIFGISLHTVKNHMRRILTKLNVSNRTKAMIHFRQMSPKPQTIQTQSNATHDRIAMRDA